MPEPEYWHSRMSILLRYEFIEHSLLRQHELAYMTAFGSALGNSSMDPSKIFRQLTSLSESVMARMPYVQAARSRDGFSEHDDLIEEYKRLRAALTEGREDEL